MSSAREQTPSQPKLSELLNAIEVARRNWKDWQEVFEHGFDIWTNPLLTNSGMFNKFVRDYSVGRTIRKGNQDSFRRKLLDAPEFGEAIADHSGKQLHSLAEKWRRDFGTLITNEPSKPPKAIISVLSKVAAFVMPEVFFAWDSYAKRGLNMVLGRPLSYPFGAYDLYLADIDQVWHGATGTAIGNVLATQSPKPVVEGEPRFQRRVLDAYLMQIGGRDLTALTQVS